MGSQAFESKLLVTVQDLWIPAALKCFLKWFVHWNGVCNSYGFELLRRVQRKNDTQELHDGEQLSLSCLISSITRTSSSSIRSIIAILTSVSSLSVKNCFLDWIIPNSDILNEPSLQGVIIRYFQGFLQKMRLTSSCKITSSFYWYEWCFYWCESYREIYYSWPIPWKLPET